MTITRHLAITGLVQGVWYRESMRQAAMELGVSGWVRNRQDGSVEAVVQGAPDQVEALIAWARQGPPQARVTAVAVSEMGSEDEIFFSGFEKRPSA